MQRLSEHIKARNNALFKSFHEGKFLRSSKHEKSVLDLLRPGTTRTDLCDRTIRDHDEPAWALKIGAMPIRSLPQLGISTARYQ